MRCHDSTPQPLEHESPPITTRPGLPPAVIFFEVEHTACVNKPFRLNICLIFCLDIYY